MKKYNIGNVAVQIQKPDLSATLLQLYPVGSLYLSYESTSPAELIGGTWEQIIDRFIRAANDTSTGGTDNIAITAAQLASHNHGVTARKNANVEYNGNQPYNGGQFASGTHYTSRTGSNAAHSNMPAYQNVYCWRRVS